MHKILFYFEFISCVCHIFVFTMCGYIRVITLLNTKVGGLLG